MSTLGVSANSNYGSVGFIIPNSGSFKKKEGSRSLTLVMDFGASYLCLFIRSSKKASA